MAWGTQPGRGRRKAARPVISKAPNKKGARKGGGIAARIPLHAPKTRHYSTLCALKNSMRFAILSFRSSHGKSARVCDLTGPPLTPLVVVGATSSGRAAPLVFGAFEQIYMVKHRLNIIIIYAFKSHCKYFRNITNTLPHPLHSRI